MRTIILAIDALDPKRLELLTAGGGLPNFRQVIENGTFHRLPTVHPPQSPVAWASFITGRMPEDHGVCDFVVRDAKTYLPKSVYSLDRRLLLPDPFWNRRAAAQMGLTMLFLPDTFPAPRVNGKAISGMGTPDRNGTMGQGVLLTTGTPPDSDRKFLRDTIPLSRQVTQTVQIPGPLTRSLTGAVKSSALELTITRRGNSLVLTLPRQEVLLTTGSFSPYVPVRFRAAGLTKLDALIRFFLVSTQPELTLYMLPPTLDPLSTDLRISSPHGYAGLIAQQYGPFSTLGIPYDSKAYEQGIFSKDQFIRSMDDIWKERSSIALGELSRSDDDVFIFYDDLVDIAQHMFWSDDSRIGTFYRRIDTFLGQVLKLSGKETNVIILSDHGFASFDEEVHLNSLIQRAGYQSVGDSGIEWTKTAAYAVGFSSIYLNLIGRESHGTVAPKNRDRTARMIIRAIKNVIRSLPHRIQARWDIVPMEKSMANPDIPDILYGFAPPYRASWQTAVGMWGEGMVSKRTSLWRGDHIFDPAYVPGMIATSHPSGLSKRVTLSTVMQDVIDHHGTK